LKEHKIENKKEEFNEKTKKTNEVNKKKYLVVKKPVEKSIFYQHQKQGMKYWFEDAKTKSCQFNLSQNYIWTLLNYFQSEQVALTLNLNTFPIVYRLLKT